jgi:hypothetical protein
MVPFSYSPGFGCQLFLWGSTGNGYIEQYHSGILSLGGGGGFQVIPKVENKQVTTVKIKAGNVYFKGVQVGTSPEQEMGLPGGGDVYLVVNFDIWGEFTGTQITDEPPTADPFMLSIDALGKEGIYVFHLAHVEDSGAITQYTLGDVYCNFHPGTYFVPGPSS